MTDAELGSDVASLPNRLRKVRNQLGLTQHELSRLSGVGINQIALYELGNHEPSVKSLVKIARTLGVSVDYLVGLSDEQQGQVVVQELTPYERMVLDAFRNGGWPGVAHLSVEQMSK